MNALLGCKESLVLLCSLDPALLRPGRLDRKIEIPLPGEQQRLEILKIHSAKVSKHGDIGTCACS